LFPLMSVLTHENGPFFHLKFVKFKISIQVEFWAEEHTRLAHASRGVAVHGALPAAHPLR